MKTQRILQIILYTLLLIGVHKVGSAQTFGYEQSKDYAYILVGSSYAKTPHTNNYTPNAVATIGARYKLIDISVNYEYVHLKPGYHSYFAQLQIVPFEIHNYEFLIGGKYGRIIRGYTYFYSGVNGEVRAKFNWFIVSLCGSYDYRGDLEIYESSNWKYTTHLKIGIKL